MANHTILMSCHPPAFHLHRILAAFVALLLLTLMPIARADDLADAQRLRKQGQLPQALDKVEAYVVSKPKEPQGRFLKGLILTEMGRSPDAIAVFGKLTEDFPELPEPYNNLAVLYAQQKQYEKARTALEMAIRTNPGYATAYENLGDVYVKIATQAYEKALQLDATNKGLRGKLTNLREVTSGGAKTSLQQGEMPLGGTTERVEVAKHDGKSG